MSKVATLQDTFLNQVRKQKAPVTVFLVNGVRLKGSLTGFDQFTIVLTVDGKQQLIFKHAVSTMVPDKSVPLSENK